MLLMLATASVVYSQNPELDKWVSNNKKTTAKTDTKSVVELPKSNIALAGLYLKKSAQYQYGAIGFATTSTAMLIASSAIKDKFELDKKTSEVKKKNNGTKDILLVGGGACALTAIILELYSIDYKLKSGEYLRLQATPTGAGLALIF